MPDGFSQGLSLLCVVSLSRRSLLKSFLFGEGDVWQCLLNKRLIRGREERMQKDAFEKDFLVVLAFSDRIKSELLVNIARLERGGI